jgi:hypothetical protein
MKKKDTARLTLFVNDHCKYKTATKTDQELAAMFTKESGVAVKVSQVSSMRKSLGFRAKREPREPLAPEARKRCANKTKIRPMIKELEAKIDRILSILENGNAQPETV